MKYYLILSQGAYSDYEPQYYVGDKEITQKEYDEKAREFGDITIAEWKNAPTRPHVHTSNYCCSYEIRKGTYKDFEEKYNPETGKAYYQRPNVDAWLTRMREWIAEQGFEPLSKDIPEVNVAYGDIPFNEK